MLKTSSFFDVSDEEIGRFNDDGYLIKEQFIDMDEVQRLRARFEPMFRGVFETGLYPDEWNWVEGRDAPDRTRQICNGWKSDRTVAARILNADVGRACARLAGWPGARIGQDNVLWKPPGAKSLGFHQDDAYCQWVAPSGYITVWLALDDTTADGGTLEYARGSHKWGVRPPQHAFHAPDDYRAAVREAAAAAQVATPEIVPVEVPAGGGAIHHGGTWHGSGPNRLSTPRRAVVTHCISSEARFHPTEISYIYNRYKLAGVDRMDESFFPIIWRQDGYRTAFLDAYLEDGAEPKS
jgi:ectoine hydroxylase-related dioxygenase (phytanoyl-CoA dioxygenase family)